MDLQAIKQAAEGYKADMTAFLRAMISHPSESCEEKEVVMCIKAELEKLGYDEVEIDGLGNVIGWMGEGDKIIAIDSHIDTVGIGNIDNWTADPYKGYEDDEVIYGRGGAIKQAAEGYKADMTAFLRAMISHPSESCEEKEVVMCIKAEMEKLGYDEVEIDGLGNVIGWMGEGDKIIAIDSHVDTVGIGNIENWTHDPYEGYEDDEVIYGRGGSDQEGGMASATYAAKMMKDMTAFLRAMISHPSESCEEKEVVMCIKAEMEKLGYDEVEIDGLGNVIGWMGEGDKIIAIDSHVDTVGIGNIENWTHDPYEGYEDDEVIYGRGGSDQEGGMASATYAAKMMKDLNLIPEGYKIMVVGSVQEEDCDGMCWQYICNKYFASVEEAREKIAFVISTEPTDGGIYRGHRGRMEIRVDVHGVSCHGSAPDRGDNAIYKMADIIADVRALNNNGCDESTDIKGLVKMLDPKYNPEHYEDARFLGCGTCTVSQIFYTSPSRCAVADSCAISIDRRMTAGETWDSCLDEIRNLPACKKYGDDVEVSMYMYDRPSWTGEVYETESYFPTWINAENAAHVQALADAHHGLFGEERIGCEQSMDKRHRPLIDKWTFSTNCVSIQGRYGIPCVGFGPGAESQAHAPNEVTYKQDLVTAAALYTAAVNLYDESRATGDVTVFRAGATDNDIK